MRCHYSPQRTQGNTEVVFKLLIINKKNLCYSVLLCGEKSFDTAPLLYMTPLYLPAHCFLLYGP